GPLSVWRFRSRATRRWFLLGTRARCDWRDISCCGQGVAPPCSSQGDRGASGGTGVTGCARPFSTRSARGGRPPASQCSCRVPVWYFVGCYSLLLRNGTDRRRNVGGARAQGWSVPCKGGSENCDSNCARTNGCGGP